MIVFRPSHFFADFIMCRFRCFTKRQMVFFRFGGSREINFNDTFQGFFLLQRIV